MTFSQRWNDFVDRGFQKGGKAMHRHTRLRPAWQLPTYDQNRHAQKASSASLVQFAPRWGAR